MSTFDDRMAVIPYDDWYAHEYDYLTKPGFRPISAFFLTSIASGNLQPPFQDSFAATYVKIVLQLKSHIVKAVYHKTKEEVEAIVADSKKTSHPLRCISLYSYFPSDSGSIRRYAAILIENTLGWATDWHWWFDAPYTVIKNEVNQVNYRLVHLSPTAHPNWESYGFDAIAVSNTGDNSRWWASNTNMTRPQVNQLLADNQSHNPRIYQLSQNNHSTTNENIWTAILVEKGPNEAWYDPDKTFDELTSLAQQRHARILDLVYNTELHDGNRAYSATMLKCS